MSLRPRGRCSPYSDSRGQGGGVPPAALPHTSVSAGMCVYALVRAYMQGGVRQPSLKPVSFLLLSHKATVFTPRWRRQRPVFGHVRLFSWCRELAAAEAPCLRFSRLMRLTLPSHLHLPSRSRQMGGLWSCGALDSTTNSCCHRH